MSSIRLDHLRAWLEQGTVHIKTEDPSGDPVELSDEELRELVRFLSECLRVVDEGASD